MRLIGSLSSCELWTSFSRAGLWKGEAQRVGAVASPASHAMTSSIFIQTIVLKVGVFYCHLAACELDALRSKRTTCSFL